MNRKTTFGRCFIKMAVWFIIFLPVFSFGQNKTSLSFSTQDAQKLKSGDHNDVADVLYKLSDIFTAQGKEGLKPAVAPLIDCAWRELKLPEDDRWNIFDILKILSKTGDERIKPILLTAMSSMTGGGNPYVAQGLLSLGSSVVKDVADSLKSSSSGTRARAAQTLYKMADFDKAKTFFTGKDRAMIKQSLLITVTDKDPSVRIYTVAALGYFGDETTIPLLKNIQTSDAYVDSGGIHKVRVEAQEALKKLQVKKK
jgi:HEAT repeat protein